LEKILIIEDDPILSKNIKEALQSEGMECECVFDGYLAERRLKKGGFNCIIMDINLPGRNGYLLCQDFRQYDRSTPVLMLTAFDDLADKVKGFESGADDYLTKPFFMRELLMRVRVLLKRSALAAKHERGAAIFTADDIVIDTLKKQVFRQNKEVALTPREYQILLRLCESAGEIISKEDFIKELWGSAFNANTNTIEVYINFLRNKLDKPFGKNSIKTKVGYGYFFESE
jgi:two-component system, OmpR family, response regulator